MPDLTPSEGLTGERAQAYLDRQRRILLGEDVEPDPTEVPLEIKEGRIKTFTKIRLWFESLFENW